MIRKGLGLMAGAVWLYAASWLEAAPGDRAVLWEHSGEARIGLHESLTQLKAGGRYTVLVSLASARSLAVDQTIPVTVRQGDRVLLSKRLHVGDADLSGIIQVGEGAPPVFELAPATATGSVHVRVTAVPASAVVEAEPNDEWTQANAIQLGQTVFGSADDVPYLPIGRAKVNAAEQGVDWFRFDFQADRPKLVYFWLDLMERDNIPVDVSIYQVVKGVPTSFVTGGDPVMPPHEVQALPGNKFTTRVLSEKGTYYLRVVANHPEYKLRTRVYDVPPYSDPQQAVRTAVDYILGAGDSWHANTPRRGGVYDRVENVHQETALCVACHATHFPLRAQLYASAQGYPVAMRQQLQFLTERFYNNPRPFYGFEEQGTVWARMISAPANVLGRMSHLLSLYEFNVTGEARPAYHEGVRQYLDLYYRDRTKLPPDETNGNTPLVSTYEVAWYAWQNTHDPRIAAMVQEAAAKNLIDLCYQTLALAAIDKVANAARIQRNAERILSLQRPSGQWAARFEADQPEVEFQTGHALWALQAAGIPSSDARVRKGIEYLLGRQQPFGGWLDPLQSYENFRTPFRETQMSVLALSAYFPRDGRRAGWDSPHVARLTEGDELAQMDQVWDQPTPELVKQLTAVAEASPDAFLRQGAVEALGRLALAETMPVLIRALGDESKLVQRTAAWAVRQQYSRHPQMPAQALLSALRSQDARTRWGATRVFAVHFAGLAKRPELADGLLSCANDPVVTVRLQAIKGLWAMWFWAPQPAVKSRIEDALLAQLGDAGNPPWIERNLREAVYNLADENIRYLYNNWVPLLGTPDDRTRAIQGRLAVESRLADKFVKVLATGPEPQKKALLAALTEYPLRRADIYDPNANTEAPFPHVYNRIGNDIEQIVFFGPSATNLAAALIPLLSSTDPEMRRLAAASALLVRDVKFPGVNEIAGAPGPERAEFLTAVMKSEATPPEVTRALKPAPRVATTVTTATTVTSAGPKKKLDEVFFEEQVKPILEAKGKDGYACGQCHATHTLFNATFQTAGNVVNTDVPEDSLILRKPISTAETEGVAGSGTVAHGGGIRFEKGSAEYMTILNWIRAAKP